MKINKKNESGIIEVPLLIILGLVSIAGVFYGGMKFSESRQNKLNKSLTITTIPTPISIVDHPVDQQLVITEPLKISQIPKNYQTQIEKETAIPIKTTVSTVNWKTYKNENLGFQIKYPNDWVVNSFDSNRIVFSQQGEGFWLMDIGFETKTNSFDSNVQSIISSLKRNDNNLQINLSDTVIGRLNGKKINVHAEGGEIVQYLLQAGDRFYTIIFRSESEENDTILKNFQLISVSDFGLINSNYKIIRNTSTQLSIQGPGYLGKVQDLSLNFYKFKKSSGQKLEDWIEQNKNNLPSPISFDGNCYNFGSSETITIYNCGRIAEQDYLVNKAGDSILFISQGQDPPLTASDLLNLISFR